MAPGAKEQCLDRSGGDAERAGDVAHGHLVAVERITASVLPRAARPPPATACGRAHPRSARSARLPLRPAPARCRAACLRAAPSARDAAASSAPAAPRWTPATDRTDGLVVVIEVRVGPDKGVLRDLFGGCRLPHHHQDQAEQPALIGVHQASERFGSKQSRAGSSVVPRPNPIDAYRACARRKRAG